MMGRVVFLLEEYSMKVLLERLLPRLFPDLRFLCVPHEGKQDLEKSVPRKLRAWNEPGARFVIIRDNDCGDCRALKDKLASLCREGGRDDVLVRIACQELEAWYIGDPEALAEAYGNEPLRHLGRKARFRDADTVLQPSVALAKLIPEFQKVSGARRMGGVLNRERNQSASFQATMAGIEALLLEIEKTEEGT